MTTPTGKKEDIEGLTEPRETPEDWNPEGPAGGPDDKKKSQKSSKRSSSSSRKSTRKSEAQKAAEEIEASSQKEFEKKFKKKYVDKKGIAKKGSIVTKRGGSKEYYVNGKLAVEYTPEGKRRFTTGTYTDPVTGSEKRVKKDRTYREQAKVSRQRRAEREFYKEKQEYREKVADRKKRLKELKRAERLQSVREVTGLPDPLARQREIGRIESFLERAEKSPYSEEFRQDLRERKEFLQEGPEKPERVSMVTKAPEKPERVSMVTKAPEPEGFISKAQSEVRKQSQIAGRNIRTGDKPLLNKLFGVGLGAASSVLGTARFAKSFFERPIQTTKQSALGAYNVATGQRQLTRIGDYLRERPGFSTGFVGAESATDLLLTKGTSSIFKLGETGASFARGGFRPARKGVIRVGDDLEDIRIAGGAATTSESLARQARRAGQKADPVSAQRGLFSSRKPKSVVIDKPKPTIESSELERAFFADPESRLRTSRLGEGFKTEQKQSFFDKAVDSVTEPVTFKRQQKPQAIAFERQRVRQFPSDLSDVRRTLERGDDLSPKQARRLEQFQLQQSGQFSPVGFPSTESEITAAPGDVLVPKRTGFTIIEGKPVSIFKTTLKRGADVPKKQLSSARRFSDVSRTPARTVSVSPSISQSLRQGFSGYPSASSSFSTSAFRKSVSGFSSDLSRKPFRSSQFSSVGRSGFTSGFGSSTLKSGPSGFYGFSRVSSGMKSGSSGFSQQRRGSLSQTSRKPRARTKPKTDKKRVAKPTRSDSRKKKREKIPGYNVFVRKGGERVQINEKPLTKNQALNKMARRIDTTPRASGSVQKSKSKVRRSKKTKLEKDLFKQFRTKETKRGKRYVEKNKFRIDSPGELSGITRKGLRSIRNKRNIL